MWVHASLVGVLMLTNYNSVFHFIILRIGSIFLNFKTYFMITLFSLSSLSFSDCVVFSGLVHLPELYSSFVEDQYKFVFAIAIQYTNPFKYVCRSHLLADVMLCSVWLIYCFSLIVFHRTIN